MLSVAVPGLPPPKSGKVREVYDLGDLLLLVTTDRISAFDVIMANGIPDKGIVLTQMSAFWFNKLAHLGPHHVVSTDDAEIASRVGSADLKGRSMLCRKAEPLTIECVARGYLEGSWYKDYAAGERTLHGVQLPDGLLRGSRLPEPIFTPATKAQSGHDINIDFTEAANLVGSEVAAEARDWTLALYREAAAHAEASGLILADTKFEFGLTEGGLIWIDEALTPDSSRYWEAKGWDPGHAQPSYDKQFVRDYLETIQWDKQPPGPTLPEDVVAKTRERYLEAYQRITGSVLAL